MENFSGFSRTSCLTEDNSTMTSRSLSLYSSPNLDIETTEESVKLDGNSCNLIVNYLPQNMTEGEIKELFATVGTVSSCKLMKDRFTSVSLGYAFVGFNNLGDCAKAIESFDKLKIQNKRLKVSYSRPSSPTIKGANVYFSGLPTHYTELDLENLVSSYGNIINHTILRDSNGDSRGVGFVRFNKKSEADAAVCSLNSAIPPGGTNALIVKPANPPKVYQTFAPLKLSNSLIVDGRSSVINSVLNKNNMVKDDSPINSLASTSIVSQVDISSKPPLKCPCCYGNPIPMQCITNPPTVPCSIFVYNIPPEADDSLLYKLFSPFGAISTVKVIPQKSYGFVNMLKYDESVNAISCLNGLMIGDRILQVSFKIKEKNSI